LKSWEEISINPPLFGYSATFISFSPSMSPNSVN